MISLLLEAGKIIWKPCPKTSHGEVDIGAYSEATDRPCLVLHPKDKMVHCFNSQAPGEVVCLVCGSQHYELLLCGDDELREIWQRAEDGGYSGYRGAAKSKASLKLSDFASEKSLKLSDYASCKNVRSGRVISNKFVKSRKGMSKASIADAQSSGSCAARRVTSAKPAEQPVMDSHSWTCPLCNVTVSAVGPKKAIYTARYNHLKYRHKGVHSRSVIGTRTVAPVCQVSYNELPDHAIGWHCPWCPAVLPALEHHALTVTDAVKQHCKDKHPGRNLRKIQSARWKAKDSVLMAWRKRANVKIIQTHQARRKDKCKGHAIIPLTVDWNEWPRRISPNRDALGRRRKPTAPRDVSFLTCTNAGAVGK